MLAAEDALLTLGADRSGPTVQPERAQRVAAERPPGRGYALSGEDQAPAAVGIATSGRVVDVLVGPAGTGKTTCAAFADGANPDACSVGMPVRGRWSQFWSHLYSFTDVRRCPISAYLLVGLLPDPHVNVPLPTWKECSLDFDHGEVVTTTVTTACSHR